MSEPENSFIERVAEWYGEGTLQDELDDLLDECAHKVTTDTEEQTHENKILFEKFESILESNLSTFCKLEGITELEFFKRCEEESAVCQVCGSPSLFVFVFDTQL